MDDTAMAQQQVEVIHAPSRRPSHLVPEMSPGPSPASAHAPTASTASPVHAIRKDKRRKTVFLAGTISRPEEPDWRELLISRLAHVPITIFNPKRDDWDSTWREDMSDARWREQVEWELEMQERADLVVVLLQGPGDSPISMLELGLAIRSGKALVCVGAEFGKRAHVEAACARYGTTCVSSSWELRDAVIAKCGVDSQDLDVDVDVDESH